MIIEHVFLSLRDSVVGWSMHLWRAEGARHNNCEKEMLTEKLQIDTETEMLDRGTLASLSVGDDCRVVQRVKLCVCEIKIKRGRMTACSEGKKRRLMEKQINRKIKMLASVC